ncbi:MAG TPA: hypothetical protein QF624_06535 [Dehalococcoidia bacterium]|jgi:hypothetical protein|nr:hypothetical protein [Dehalococcoidia bacterium]
MTGPTVLIAISLLGIGAIIWGGTIDTPQFQVSTFDAGPVTDFAIGEVVPFEEPGIYVYGLRSGQIRVIDGVVRTTGCRVEWLPDDRRTTADNPGQRAGAFVDPCSDARWAIDGDAVDGTSEPLRTFVYTARAADDGIVHIYVELIGRDASGEAAAD